MMLLLTDWNFLQFRHFEMELQKKEDFQLSQ